MPRVGFHIGGVFTLTCRDKLTGKIKWVEKTHNLITNQGLNHILDVLLHGTTPTNPWYCLLFNTNTTPLATHTYAAPGFTESTAYDEAARPAYVEAASSGQQITNSANRAVFTMSGTTTIYGAALVSLSTKGDTAGGGVLLCSGLFTNEKIVNDDDILELQYTITAADDGV